MNITVSIGRNAVRGEPELDDREWAEFKKDAMSAVERHGEVVQWGNVNGVWDGQQEESWTVTAALTEWGERSLDRLRVDLAYLARTYGQKSIALTKAEPVFIEAARVGESDHDQLYRETGIDLGQDYPED